MHKYQDLAHPLLSALLVGVLLPAPLGLVLAATETPRFGALAWLVAGSLWASVTRPVRWELDGQTLTVTQPPWNRQTRADLQHTQSIQGVPHPKGGFDAYLVAASGHKILLPTDTDRRALRFRADILTQVPERALAQVRDPQALGLLMVPSNLD